MPIQSITNNTGTPVIGTIRLGIRKESKSGSEYPENTGYFVLHDAPQVISVYGNEPQELDIAFPSDDLEKVMPTWLKWFGAGVRDKTGKTVGGSLKCKGNGPDGEGNPGQAQFFAGRDAKTGVVPVRPCLGESCPDWNDAKGYRQCKPTMQIYVMLPKVSPFGVFLLTTTSWRAIKSFHDQIEWVRKLNNNHIALMPFKLRKEQQQVTYVDANGKEQKKAAWITVLKPNENRAEIEGMKDNLGVLAKAALDWSPNQAILDAAPAEDNFPAYSEQDQMAQIEAHKNVMTAESLLQDAEIQQAFTDMEKAYGKAFAPKDRMILIRKKEGSADLKAAVLDGIGLAISSQAAKVKTETAKAEARKAADAEAKAYAEEKAKLEQQHPETQGII